MFQDDTPSPQALADAYAKAERDYRAAQTGLKGGSPGAEERYARAMETLSLLQEAVELAVATRLLRNGVDLHRVQRFLRHADSRTMATTYGHLILEDLRGAAELL